MQDDNDLDCVPLDLLEPANQARQRLSVVCPCYNEEEVIGLFYKALKETLSSMSDIEHEIVFVDDGSTDGTLDELNAIAELDASVKVYSLSRNFGHQIALSAGLDVARGTAVILMDSDLQHPPELIPQMVKRWREGNDIVSAVRVHTEDASWFKRLCSKFFYWIINTLSSTQIPAGAADFCLLSRRAHRALLDMPERHRFLRGLVSWMGFHRVFVPFVAPERAAGKSKYSLGKMIALAFDAAFSFSAAPMRLATRLGLTVVFLGFVYFAYILGCYIFGKSGLVPGWGSLICVLLILGGAQLAFIGLIGEYLARVFEEVKRRPLYFFKQTPSSDRTAAVRPLQGTSYAGH